METGRFSGHYNNGYTYQTGIRDFYESFGVDKLSSTLVTPVLDDKKPENGYYRNPFQTERALPYSAAALDDEDEEEDDELDVDELDLDDEDEDEDESDEEAEDEDIDPDLDITEDEEEEDDII